MIDGVEPIANEQELPAIGGEAKEPVQEPEELEVDEAEATADDIEGDEGEEEGQESEPEEDDDLEEVEFEGKNYKVPKEIKLGLMRTDDYTRKTQATAELKKTYEAKLQEAEAAFTVSQEVLEQRATLMNIDAQLNQYQNLDWQQLEQEDPLGATSHWRQFQQLKEMRGQVAENLNKVQAERSAKAEQETANRLRQTFEFAQKNIPGWTRELDEKIGVFAAKELGFGPEQVRNALTPEIYKTLHLAWIGAQALERQKGASAPKSQQQPVKPLQTVKAKGGTEARKDVSDMSMEEYAAYRNRQERAKSLKR